MRALAVVLVAASVAHAQGAAVAGRGEWTAYDALGSRFSPLAQITRENVRNLEVAWTYRTGDTTQTRQPTKFEATPLMVDGTLNVSTPFARVIALDPATRREKWTFDPHTDRAVTTWWRSRFPLPRSRHSVVPRRRASRLGGRQQVRHVHVEVLVNTQRGVRRRKPHGLPCLGRRDAGVRAGAKRDAHGHVEAGHDVRPVI
jgi:hypothetical protein